MTKKENVGSTSQSGVEAGSGVDHLDRVQVDRLTQAFEFWYESAPSHYIRRVRGRYWIAYLLLRFTGARIGEILGVDDTEDVDFKQSEVTISVSIQRSPKRMDRTIPVPQHVISHIVSYLQEHPRMRGKVFSLDQGNFRREFYRRAEEAELPRDLSHPHILRHTRAMELLKAGVPLTTVQNLLGHALSSTTAMYLERSDATPRKILKDKGLL